MTLVAARAHLPCRIFRDLPRGPRRRTPRCVSQQEVSQEEAVNHTERAFQSFKSLTHIQFQGFPTRSLFSNPPGHDASTVDYRHACLTLRSCGSLRFPHRRRIYRSSCPFARPKYDARNFAPNQWRGHLCLLWTYLGILGGRCEVMTLAVGSNVYQILNDLRGSRR